MLCSWDGPLFVRGADLLESTLFIFVSGGIQQEHQFDMPQMTLHNPQARPNQTVPVFFSMFLLFCFFFLFLFCFGSSTLNAQFGTHPGRARNIGSGEVPVLEPLLVLGSNVKVENETRPPQHGWVGVAKKAQNPSDPCRGAIW